MASKQNKKAEKMFGPFSAWPAQMKQLWKFDRKGFWDTFKK